MKLNISYPPSGCQKCIEVDDEKKLRTLYDKRISQEVNGDDIGEQFKGYIFKITGGNDKQGFPMKQGILTNTRIRLMMGKNTTCYRPRRTGERKRKSIRGCIVGADLSVVHLVIVKKGEEELPGLTDKYIPRRLGPKRASKIRKLFNLSKEDDVRKYVIRRELVPKEGKTLKGKKTKAPKIQRLVTPVTLQRKRHRLALKKQRAEKNKTEAADYAKLLAQKSKEQREKRQQSISKKRGTSQKEEKPAVVTPAPKETKKVSAVEPKKVVETKKPAVETKKAEPKKSEPKKSEPPKKQETKKEEKPAPKKTEGKKK